ncbi:MAG: hypothetical protein JW943_09010 [Deltaproteobacteria bacterium]|nr:hypothetical protein [Deltaproteobacteria bacterium]
MGGIKGQRILAVILFLVGIFFLHPGVSPAQQKPQLDLKTTVEKEVKIKKDGKWATERMPVEKAGRGDVLAYTVTYLNTGKTDAVDAQIVNPIPRGVAIIPESPEGKDAEISVSIDGGKSWHKPPVTVQIKKPDGTTVVTPVSADRYTHVRWIIKKPVMSGRSGQVGFRATVK